MRLEEIELKTPVNTTHFPAADTAAVATKAAPGAGRRIWVRGITVSADAAPGAGFTVTLRSGAGTVMEKFYLPNAAFAPVSISYRPPLAATENEAVTLETTAPTGGTKAGVTLRTIEGSV